MKTRLSLVMIVRDEAEMLPAFLASVEGLWDELVVVDTGSTDGSAALLEAAGARVLHHPWSDDFSDARNVSLAAATGDWVLVLDADERASPAFASELRARMDDPTLGALWLVMSNALPYGHRRQSLLLRAWRADPAVRFRHAIHEDVSASVAQMLQRTNRTHDRLEAPIEHLGYVRSRAAAKDKKTRDLAILTRCLDDDPLDHYSRLKVLELARFWHDGLLWRDHAKEASEALVLAGPTCLTGRPWGGELVALVAEGLFRPESQAGLHFLDGWAERVSPSAAFFYRRGVAHEHQGHVGAARSDYLRCLELADGLGDGQLTGVRPLLGLTRLALGAGNLADASQYARQAVAEAPRDPEALVAAATLARSLEGPRGLVAWEAEHRNAHPSCPERDWAIGEALYALEDFEGAVGRLRVAAGVPPAGPAGVRLAQALLASGALESAEATCRTVLPTDAEAGLGLLVFDLLHGRDSALDLELTAETADAAMRHWVDALLASRIASLRGRFARNVGAVSDVFPWLGEYLDRRVG